MRRPLFLLLILSAFMLSGCLAFGNLVWEDLNGNGIQDAGEPGVAGVSVNLVEADGEVVESVQSDSQGLYQINYANPSGSYYLQFVAPTGYQFTLQDQGSDDSLDSDVDPNTGESGLLTRADNSSDLDAGLVPVELGARFEAEALEENDLSGASIGDFVWHDENRNGLQDEGEGGVEAVLVTLIDGDGQEVASTSTDAEGFYEFSNLSVGGIYKLQFDPPENYLITLQDAGDDSLDSDPFPDNNRTAPFTLGSDGTSDIDAGVYIPATGAASFCYGPGADPFPEGVSPLSGLPVSEPNYLGLNPVFTSISIFPPSVRPPSGLSTAPQVFQLYIGDGDSRLLVVNYGEFPTADYSEDDEGEGISAIPESQVDDQYVIAGKVWFDTTPNHLLDDEPGISEVPVRLVDINLNTVQTTTTVAGGYYWFVLDDVATNTEYQVRVGAPPNLPGYYFVNKDVGNDDTIDSDVTAQGYTDFFDPTDGLESETLFYDAGVRASVFIEGFRSGRSAHQDIQGNYCGCLISAGADPVVGEGLNTCANAFSSDPNNIGGAGLDVTRLLAIAQNYTENSSCQPNLADAALFCTEAPDGGSQGNELYMLYNINNISHFIYDAAQGGYTWWLSTPKSEALRGSAPFSVETEEYTQMLDGLTDETLTFENVVVLRVEHTAQNSAVTIIDLEMDFQTGTAFVFRNGQVFEATWSSLYPDYVVDKDNPLPVHLEVNGEPFALAPGQTFFNIVNEYDSMTEISTGVWLADFDAPAYSPQ